MTIGPSCIFRLNGPAFLIHHPKPPSSARYWIDSIYVFNQAEYALMGTTQTNINDFLTAHNNYGQPFYLSDNQFYSELFHELHHVYQRNHIKHLKFDNPADALSYPEDDTNDAIKQYENELLLELLLGPAQQFTENLNKFFSCRILRKTIIGEKHLNYEKAVESAEGPATYCEYLYMNEFSTTISEQEYINKRFFYSLVEPTYGREGLRNKHLLTGMIQCLLLSRNFKNWQTDFYGSGLTLNDYFFSKFSPRQVELPSLSFYKARAKYFTNLEREKRKKQLNSFNNQGGTKITVYFDEFPKFSGFDPMHADAIADSLIIHSTLLKLERGANHFSAADHRILTQTNGQVWFVKTLAFFVTERDIDLKGNVFTYKNETLNIKWRYLKHEKKDNEHLIFLE